MLIKWTNKHEMRAMDIHGRRDGNLDGGADTQDLVNELFGINHGQEDAPSSGRCHHGKAPTNNTGNPGNGSCGSRCDRERGNDGKCSLTIPFRCPH
mmetsp:Transcript_19944/g.47953  ORF Transcript_19944/g.47953 Transcript_19944/m.47953 type:complete len:96 (+) Transcript_19944:110-397(+)